MIVLASTSPRRRELLKKAVPAFLAIAPHAEEIAEGTPETVAVENARRKAHSLRQEYPEALIIGADTVVALGDVIFGKPQDLNDAKRMLQELSGKTHCVLTGVVLNSPEGEDCFCAKSEVHFRPLSQEDIETYLKEVDVLDKAGGYAIQEHGDCLVDSYSGELDNIIGLPTQALKERLIFWQR